MAKILVVDDEPSLREMVKEMLVMNEHAATTADDAAAGLEELKKEPYDLLIIDRNMPGMTGVDAINILRADPKFAKLKILMLTGASVTTEIDEAFEAGADGYVIKPLNIKQLIDKVAAVLKA